MLVRRSRAGRRITLVPLIDVLFILLVYFMVTSVYRNLDMIPVVQSQDQTTGTTQAASGDTLLLRITADGKIALRGDVLEADALVPVLAQTTGRVLILPSGAAPLWALAEVLDAVSLAGISNAQLVRLEALP